MKWVTAVISKLKGTMPDPKVEFIMSTMMGHRLGRHTLTKALGMGSREQGEGLGVVLCLGLRESVIMGPFVVLKAYQGDKEFSTVTEIQQSDTNSGQ